MIFCKNILIGYTDVMKYGRSKCWVFNIKFKVRRPEKAQLGT